VLKDRQRFFRRGSSGEGRDVLSSAEMNRYEARVSALAPDDLVAWLHMRR
jgi:aryl sulfotransferase